MLQLCIVRPAKSDTQQNESNLNQFMIKLHLVHRNLISLHRHRYIDKKNGVENFENNQLHQLKKSNDIREQNKKQAACAIITELRDG